MRWTVGLCVGFAVMFLMNAIFIYVAVSTAESVTPSYESAPR